MLRTAVLGGTAGAVVSVLLPMLLGAARQRVPRWFGFLRIAYVRTVAVTVFGVAITTGINLSTSDHSHRSLSYVVWYGVAGIALIAALAATIVIDRSLARDTPPPSLSEQTPEAARNAKMNRFIRQRWHEHKGERAVRDADRAAAASVPTLPEPPLSDADRTRIARETEQRIARTIHDPTLRALDKTNKAAVQSKFEPSVSNSQQEPDPLVALYREGERLRASISRSILAIPGDLIHGMAAQRQVAREQLARDWDERLLDALADDARPKWTEAGTLPASKLDYVTTIAGVREFLTKKLECLREIIAASEADIRAEPLSLPPPEVEQREKRTRAIKDGEALARLILHAELQDDGSIKARQTLVYNLGARVEPWARTIGAREDAPKFSGDPEGDLARLKVSVAKALTRLHAEQEQERDP